MPASRDLPTSLEPTSLTAGEAGDFKCLRDPSSVPQKAGAFSLASTPPAITQSNASPGAHASPSRIGFPRPTLGTTVSAPLSFALVFLGLALHGRCIR